MEKNLSEQLADNLAYYVNDPNKRCKNDMGKCSYSGKTIGKNTMGCFVGRLMKPIDRKKADEKLIGSVVPLIQDAKNCGIKLPNIIADNGNLMQDFQALHDDDTYWTKEGFTERGKKWLNTILEIHGLERKYFAKFLAE